MGALQGMVINWWAHKLGYKNYNLKNTSKNILPVDFLFMGEAYHNNHRKHPGKANNAVKWFEYDITFGIIKLMHRCNIIQLRTLPLIKLKSKVSLAGDGYDTA